MAMLMQPPRQEQAGMAANMIPDMIGTVCGLPGTIMETAITVTKRVIPENKDESSFSERREEITPAAVDEKSRVPKERGIM